MARITTPLSIALLVFSVDALEPVSIDDNETSMNRLTDYSSHFVFSSQSRQELRRDRPRVRVERYQPPAYDYPRPEPYAWPGPGAVRQCVDWYATEYRPSGTVITPQMRCRWVRG